MGTDAVRSGRAGLLHDLLAKQRERLYTRNAYTLGKGELAWDTWPNHLVGRSRPSLQSGNETNDLLKSGPALAGPAGPATPLLRVLMVEVNAICLCGDHATVLLLQGSPVSYLRRSNSDAAFTLKDFVLYVLCVSAVLFSVVIFCMLHAGRLQKK